MIDDIVEKYLNEGVTSMTFGVMPSFKDFQKNFKRSVKGSKLYPYTLKGEDKTAAHNAGIPVSGEFTDKELYDIVKKLNKTWEYDGDEDAGSLASGIMDTLDFEWI